MAAPATSGKRPAPPLPLLLLLYHLPLLYLLLRSCRLAYAFRLHAITTYGHVVHEFDPYFQLRASQYLADHGPAAFFRWFDHSSWYPLGRPVGTTIYPGPQIVAVLIWRVRNALASVLGWPSSQDQPAEGMSLNDVCCRVPAWFGVAASLGTGLLAGECSPTTGTGGRRAGRGGAGAGAGAGGNSYYSLPSLVVGTATMAILPAHLRRSVGGGFDNECVAIPFFAVTYWLWVRAVRRGGGTAGGGAVVGGALAGVAYSCSAASWGGYVFVMNVVAVHAALVTVLSPSTSKERILATYTAFYLVGTLGSMLIPVVRWAPLRSSELLGPMMAFVILHLLRLRRRFGDTFRAVHLVFASTVLAMSLALAAHRGYLAKFSVRVLALFLPDGKATKTGNPLVDSVSEHRPATVEAYWTDLDRITYVALAGVGLLIVVVAWDLCLGKYYYEYHRRRKTPRSITPSGCDGSGGGGEDGGTALHNVDSGGRADAALFLLALAGPTYFFSLKMSRLIVLTAIPAAGLAGVALGTAVDFLIVGPLLELLLDGYRDRCDGKGDDIKENVTGEADSGAVPRFPPAPPSSEILLPSAWTRLAVAGVLMATLGPGLVREGRAFYEACDSTAKRISHPSVLWGGGSRRVDDYRESYWWIRDNTPADSRILAWWDYGYQIAAMANRTTLADGNTWNHEHIALIGLALTSPVSEGHAIARHVADYVLVWAGQRSSDLGKSKHIVQIANSVFEGHCPDRSCHNYGVHNGVATEMYQESLVAHLCENRATPAFRNRFEQVYESRHGMVRVYKVKDVDGPSRQWAADPSNRSCDAPGSWYCPGNYPPGLLRLFPSTSLRTPQFLRDAPSRDEEADRAALSNEHSREAMYHREYSKRLSRQSEALPRVNGANLPQGSYLNSCRGCSLDENETLRCTHCETAGVAIRSSLDMRTCPRNVDNIHGQLECAAEPNADDIPGGSYLGSCRGCRVRDRNDPVLARVECTHCSTADGRVREATYLLGRCPAPGVLDNQDGKLACEGIPNISPVPSGGYINSCQGCRLEGSNLKCSHCRTSDARQVEASLSMDICTGKSVDNQDGRLVCAG